MHLNQAGALVHVYQDGSVHLNHGGTEMGQGLYMKVAQVVAEEFGIAMERVRITATTTAKVPNTAPTAASSGSDLNGMAAKVACEAIKARMTAFAAEKYGVLAEQIDFRDDRVFIGNESLSFPELARACVPQPGAALPCRVLPHAGNLVGPGEGAGQAVFFISPMARPVPRR